MVKLKINFPSVEKEFPDSLTTDGMKIMRERERETDRQTDRQRETERKRDREGEIETERERKRERGGNKRV